MFIWLLGVRHCVRCWSHIHSHEITYTFCKGKVPERMEVDDEVSVYSAESGGPSWGRNISAEMLMVTRKERGDWGEEHSMWRKQYGSAMRGEIRSEKFTQACIAMMIIWTRGERTDRFEKAAGGKSHRTGLWLAVGSKGRVLSSITSARPVPRGEDAIHCRQLWGTSRLGEGGDLEFSFGHAECELPSRYLSVDVE